MGEDRRYFTYAVREVEKDEFYTIPSNGLMGCPTSETAGDATTDFKMFEAEKGMNLEHVTIDVTNLVKEGILKVKKS